MKERLRNLRKRYGHIRLALGYLCIYLPWFYWLEERTTGNYTVVHTSLDDYIPYEECFIIPYLLWFVYVAGTVFYFFVRSRQDYDRVCTLLFTGMTVSLLICTFCPNGTDLRSQIVAGDSICGRLVQLVHAVDTPTNVFPSIHVYNAVSVHLAIANSQSLRPKKWIRAGSFVLMVAICLSTMFLKQHSALDVVGALILVCMIYPFVYHSEYAHEEKEERPKAVG
ncbi:MAG: phosphatase PAP2 family protein [Clostridiales bacterium]|nr:phosphatase PAP2 family protein [Clostridiales bacterium]